MSEGREEIAASRKAAEHRRISKTPAKFFNYRGLLALGLTLIVGPATNNPTHVLVRAIGPSLSQSGVPNALQNPTLELHNGNGALVASNDDWRDTQQAEIEATGIAPTNDLESAILTAVPAGNYTAIVRGVNNTVGVGLVEAYDLR